MIETLKSVLITLALLATISSLPAQTSISLPGVYYQIFQNYPLSNEKISFSLKTPFTENKQMIPDSDYSYQFLISLPLVGDTLLSECIKYAMLSLSFDLIYKNHSKGTEIWRGLINNNLNLDPTVTGVYFRHDSDSTLVYILTTYSLLYAEKKKKTNTSQYIGESIKFILEKHRKRN